MDLQKFKSRLKRLRAQAGFTLIELMVVLSIIGIISVFATQSMLQNQKAARMNEFENEVNAAMAELTRLTTDPVTCFSTFHDLGPGNSDYAQVANKLTNWTRVPHFIYDSTKNETDPSNLIAFNFPPLQTLPDGSVTESGSPRAFRGSKILGIRSVYIAPHNYPNYPLQENLSSDFKGNAFVEITFEFIGPANTMMGLKTRTKMLPLSVTWAKNIKIVASSNTSGAAAACTKAAIDENCGNPACEGTIINTCSADENYGPVLCNCAIFKPGRQNWKIRECNSI